MSFFKKKLNFEKFNRLFKNVNIFSISKRYIEINKNCRFCSQKYYNMYFKACVQIFPLTQKKLIGNISKSLKIIGSIINSYTLSI